MSNDLHPPAENPTDAPLQCVELNENWVGYVQGLLFPALQPTYWASNGQHGADSILEILNLLAIGNCMATAPVFVKLQNSVGFSVPPNTFFELTFDTVLKDTDGLFNPATPGVIHIDRAGLWLVGGGLNWQNAPGGVRSFVIDLIGGPFIATDTRAQTVFGEHQMLSVAHAFTVPTDIHVFAFHQEASNRDVANVQNTSPTFWATFLGPLP